MSHSGEAGRPRHLMCVQLFCVLSRELHFDCRQTAGSSSAAEAPQPRAVRHTTLRGSGASIPSDLERPCRSSACLRMRKCSCILRNISRDVKRTRNGRLSYNPRRHSRILYLARHLRRSTFERTLRGPYNSYVDVVWLACSSLEPVEGVRHERSQTIVRQPRLRPGGTTDRYVACYTPDFCRVRLSF